MSMFLGAAEAQKLFDDGPFTLQPRRNYDPEVWAQEDLDERGYDRTAFHGRVLSDYNDATERVGLPVSRRDALRRQEHGWHMGTRQSAVERTAITGAQFGSIDGLFYQTLAPNTVIPLKVDTDTIPTDRSVAPLPMVGKQGEALASDRWANDNDPENSAGDMHPDEYDLDMDALRDSVAEDFVYSEPDPEDFSSEAEYKAAMADHHDEIESSVDQLAGTYGDTPFWNSPQVRTALQHTHAPDLLHRGHTIPYLNEAEDEGSTSYVAPRSAIRTWREDVLSDSQAPPRWRRIAEAGIDLHTKVDDPASAGIQGRLLRQEGIRPKDPFVPTTEHNAYTETTLFSRTRLGEFRFARDRRADSSEDWG